MCSCSYSNPNEQVVEGFVLWYVVHSSTINLVLHRDSTRKAWIPVSPRDRYVLQDISLECTLHGCCRKSTHQKVGTSVPRRKWVVLILLSKAQISFDLLLHGGRKESRMRRSGRRWGFSVMFICSPPDFLATAPNMWEIFP